MDDEGTSAREDLSHFTEDVYIRDNRDVFDDQSAQQLSAEEIKEVRSNMSSKVRYLLELR